MSICTWCGDEMKEGLWENHKCVEDIDVDEPVTELDGVS